MGAALGVLNAFWIAFFIGAKLDGWLMWGWWYVAPVALAPMALLMLLCLWAYMYDEFNRY